MFNNVMKEFNEITESDDNFFLIQQIQDRSQILETKKKQQKEIQSTYISEISELEAIESNLDDKLMRIEEQYRNIDAYLFDDIDENLVRNY